MKDAILSAAIDVIALHGLNNWTVEEVANRAHCAKGLVNYHYRSKHDLLRTAAQTVRDDRAAHRLAAVQALGTEALDRLWETLVRVVDSGWFAAWLSLLAAEDPLRKATAERAGEADSFARSLGRSLELGDALLAQAPLIQAALDGLQLRLLQGADVAETQEAYHAFWLSCMDRQ